MYLCATAIPLRRKRSSPKLSIVQQSIYIPYLSEISGFRQNEFRPSASSAVFDRQQVDEGAGAHAFAGLLLGNKKVAFSDLHCKKFCSLTYGHEGFTQQ
jgi:hypothetical protein